MHMHCVSMNPSDGQLAELTLRMQIDIILFVTIT